MVDGCAGERSDTCSSIATSNVEEPEWLGRVLAQNLVEPGIHLAMEKVIAIDDFSVDLPLPVENRLRR
jgi:hypothetical protein